MKNAKIQMTEILVNVSRNRIATDNDRAKYDLLRVVREHLENVRTNESEEYVRHLEKHLQAITDKMGTPVLKRAVVPAQKFQIIED